MMHNLICKGGHYKQGGAECLIGIAPLTPAPVSYNKAAHPPYKYNHERII